MKCEDIDECANNRDLCRPGTCVNNEGGFTCTCARDYMLSPDGQECVDMRKEQCFMTVS